MKTIDIGAAELRAIRKLVLAALRDTKVALTAPEARALETFERRMALAD